MPRGNRVMSDGRGRAGTEGTRGHRRNASENGGHRNWGADSPERLRAGSAVRAQSARCLRPLHLPRSRATGRARPAGGRGEVRPPLGDGGLDGDRDGDRVRKAAPWRGWGPPGGPWPWPRAAAPHPAPPGPLRRRPPGHTRLSTPRRRPRSGRH